MQDSLPLKYKVHESWLAQPQTMLKGIDHSPKWDFVPVIELDISFFILHIIFDINILFYLHFVLWSYESVR